MKCWIVDDEKKIVDYLAQAIDWSHYGFTHLQTFTSSKEALFRFEKGESPDLLITDIKMPEVSGLDLAQQVQGKAKVVIISGYSEFSYAQKAIHYGVLDYLLKPIFPDDLEGVVEKVIKEISVESWVKEVDKKEFYLAFLTDHLQEEPHLLSYYRKLLKNHYFPQEVTFGNEAVLTFAIDQQQFGFVSQEDKKLHESNIFPRFFEALFHTKWTHDPIKENFRQWLKQENWEQILTALKQASNDTRTTENIQTKLEILYQLNRSFPWLFKKIELTDIFNLLLDKQLLLFLEQHLKEQLIPPQDILHSILFLQDYIRDNLSSPLSLETLADRVHMHPVYLSKLFKEKTGENLSQFILEQRLLKMKDLLLKTDLKVKTITELVGYHKPQNINDFFKKRFGFNPTDYRKIHQRHEL